MKILVTNDDGIRSQGLWTLVTELKKIASVTVIVPDIERSGIGTALSLLEPLQVKEVTPAINGVTTYTVDGTPSDCVVVALGRLVRDRVDMVISGINNGSNLGEDVYISGTVGAALQGYLRGSPALAVSVPRNSVSGVETAARTAAVLAERIAAAAEPVRVLLNVNAPDLPPSEVAGIRITRLARTSHINTVEEGDFGRQKNFHLMRQQTGEPPEKGSDIYAKERGFVSITPLFTSLYERPPRRFLESLCADFLQRIRDGLDES